MSGQRGQAYHYDGKAWTLSTTDKTSDSDWLNSVWARPSGVAYAVGTGGNIYRWDPKVGIWASMTSPTTNELLSVWGSSDTLAWAVGRNGTILKWDGAAWTLSLIHI